MTKSEEHILIKNCIKGKEQACRTLYDLYAKDMFKVCLTYAPDYDSANDFLQEGFIKVFQNLHKYKSTGSLGGWMRSVMINNSIDLLRKKFKVRYHLELNDDIHTVSHKDKTLDQINTDSFFEIIKELPLGYRSVLNLYYLEDLTHKEIAEKLEITEGTSKSQLAKGKKYLEEILLKTLSHDEIEFYVGRLVKEVV